MKILITGGNGYIAKSIYSKLSTQYDITLATRQDFDLTNYAATSQFFDGKYFDVVIHTAVSGGSRLKVDTDTTILDNISMYWNLVDNQEHFGRLITFGSGAEIYNAKQPYGLSKKVINQLMADKENYYNLRIFAVFDENEWDTRFIKSNIIRYLKKENMNIHSDKFMDFFYMEDLISLVNYYITAIDPPALIDCCYLEQYKLSGVANMINTLEDYRVDISIGDSELAQEYVGNYIGLPIPLIGLQEGIRRVYASLKQNI